MVSHVQQEQNLFSSELVEITSTKTLFFPLYPLSSKGYMHEHFRLLVWFKIHFAHHCFCYNKLKWNILLFLGSNLAMLEHETVARLRNEVAGLRAEKAQLEDKCFFQQIEIELTLIRWVKP